MAGFFRDLAVIAINAFTNNSPAATRGAKQLDRDIFFQAQARELKKAYARDFPGEYGAPPVVAIRRSWGDQYGLLISSDRHVARVYVCGKGNSYYVRREDVANVREV